MDEPTITDYVRSDEGGKGSPISDEQLLDDLHRVARILGKIPSSREYEEHGSFSETAVNNHFGNWTGYISEAGYEPPSASERDPLSYSDLVEQIKIYAEKHGHPPTMRELESETRHSSSLLNYVADSWEQAISDAGLDSYHKSFARFDEYPVGLLIDEILRVAEEVDRPPYADEITERSDVSAHVIEKHFGTWGEALEYAGLPRRYQGGNLNNIKTKDNYGQNWPKMRRKTIERDRHRCQRCGMKEVEHREEFDTGLHVHHIQPLKTFNTPEDANFLENLITLCRDCHQMIEPMTQHAFIESP